MTKVGKCLVVFAVGASFAFLGFAWVSLMGGPSWDAERGALPEYTIEKGAEPDGKWTVQDRVTGESVTVPSPTVQASAIVAARNDLKKKQEEEIKRLKDQTATDKQQFAEMRKFNEADAKALEARVKDLGAQLNDLNAKILKLSTEIVQRSQEAQAVRTEAAKRREDVYRLSHELEEIRADNFRADELQRKLNDQLVRLNGVVAALENRNKQLHEQIGK